MISHGIRIFESYAHWNVFICDTSSHASGSFSFIFLCFNQFDNFNFQQTACGQQKSFRAEAKAKGFKKVTLLGQNVNSYKDPSTSFGAAQDKGSGQEKLLHIQVSVCSGNNRFSCLFKQKRRYNSKI